MTTTVRISETYDLSTQVNKMGIVGIHTPSTAGIKALYPGLCMNHRYLRIVGCDVTLACASMLPADPLQIGTEAGSIAPQDMFNPILYTACSNDSFNTLMARIYHESNVATGMSLTKADFDTETYDNFALYYGLLASPDGFRKAMPQAGLEMKGLYPIVYQMVSQYGNIVDPTSPTGAGAWTELASDGSEIVASGVQTGGKVSPAQFRGPSMRMPRLPLQQDSLYVDSNGKISLDGTAETNIPTTYVGLIITPPAKLNRLYYRMKVTWTIQFEEVVPITEFTIDETQKVGRLLYASDYVEQSSNMDTTTNSVDAKNANLDLVMTSSK